MLALVLLSASLPSMFFAAGATFLVYKEPPMDETLGASSRHRLRFVKIDGIAAQCILAACGVLRIAGGLE